MKKMNEEMMQVITIEKNEYAKQTRERKLANLMLINIALFVES